MSMIVNFFGPVSGKIKLTSNCNISKLSGYNVINMKVPGGNYSDLHACNLKTKNGLTSPCRRSLSKLSTGLTTDSATIQYEELYILSD